jgi:hypothetical protein
MSDLPFISCPTVHTAPNGVTYSCPMCVQSVAAWNHLQSINRAPVKVKPLEWITPSPTTDGQWQDSTGIYDIEDCILFIGHIETGIPFQSEKEAKAAAQADYERRIKDALETPDDQ